MNDENFNLIYKNNHSNQLNYNNSNLKSNYYKNAIEEKKSELFTHSEESELPIIDQIFSYSGFGSLQYNCFFAFGFFLFGEGFYLLLIPSTMIVFKEYNLLNENQIATITSLLFVSFGLAAALTSILTSKFSRKILLLITVLIHVPAGILVSFVNNIHVFSTGLILIGFGMGLSIPILNNTLAEVLTINLRAFALIFVWIFFVMAQMFYPIIMTFVMPNLESNYFPVLLKIGTSFVSIFLISGYLLYKESPRNCLVLNDYDKAFKILEWNMNKRISIKTKLALIKSTKSNLIDDTQILNGASFFDEDGNLLNDNSFDVENNANISYNKLVKESIENLRKTENLSNFKTKKNNNNNTNYEDEILSDNNNDINNKNTTIKKDEEGNSLASIDEKVLIKNTKTKNKKFFKLISKLFSSKEYARLTIITSILWFVNAIIMYGPSLILTLTIQKITKMNIGSELTEEDNKTAVNQEVFKELYFYATSSLICLLLSAILAEINLFGRKNTLIIAYFLGTIIAIAILIFPSVFKIWIILLSLFVSIGFNVIGSFSAELFSTDVRDTAIGFFFFANRIGAVCSQFIFLKLFMIDYLLPYVVLSGLTLIAAICSCLYPFDTLGRPLDMIK